MVSLLQVSSRNSVRVSLLPIRATCPAHLIPLDLITRIILGEVENSLMSSVYVGRDGSVGMATWYGLDGRGLNPGGGEIFHTRPGGFWGPPNLP